jgi:replicative DNA helicase
MPDDVDDRLDDPGRSATGDLAPHNVVIEQAYLGSCLMDGSALDRSTGLVEPTDFYEHAHQMIFEAMRRRRDAGGAIDHRLVGAALGPMAAEDIGGMTVAEYVARVSRQAMPPQMASDYAREIRILADRRRVIAASLEMLEGAKTGNVDPRALVESGIGELDSIAASCERASERQVSISEAVDAAFGNLLDVQAGRSRPGITTGVRDLDRVLGGGMRRGEVVILAGRPGMGKTTVALSILIAAARNEVGCYFASLEMNDVQLGERALSSIAFSRGQTIPYTSIRSGKLTSDEVSNLDGCRSEFREMPMRIEQRGGLTIQQIASRARIVANRMAAKGHKLSLIVVDHLGLVKPSSRYAGSRYDEVTELSGTLKALSKELDVAMLVLCQLNRKVEDRNDKRPQLSDLRESGAIEQDADTVIFAFREAYYLEQRSPGEDASEERLAHMERLERVQTEIELIVAKQRMGPTQPVRAYCSVSCNVVSDLAHRSMR